MAVYVDTIRPHYMGNANAQARSHGSNWCHCWADTEEELHEFATKQLKMKREWCDRKNPDFIHYDLVPSKRALAIKKGAIEMQIYDWKKGKRSHAEPEQLTLIE